MNPEMFRGIERLLIVAGGFALIFLGYQLFLRLPVENDSRGKVTLPGGISVYLSRIGPGAFLALFGAAILIVSMKQAIDVDSKRGKLRMVTEASIPQRQEWGIPPELANTLLSINGHFKPHLVDAEDETTASALRTELNRIKLPIMKVHWDTNWGSYTTFEGWVTTQAGQGAAPEGMEEPVSSFNYGL